MAKKFPGQRENEEVIAAVRKHWISLVRPVLQLLALNLVPIILFIVYTVVLEWEVVTDGFFFVLGVLLVSLYYLGTWVMYYHAFVGYHLDLWVVTDQRIINIEQNGLFDRVMSELNLSKVQDVTSEIKGQLQTIFDYGHVYIQTAGEQERFIFENVPHPEALAQLIAQLNDDASKHEITHVTPAETPAK